MIGILLVNMGSPSSQEEMKYFLNKMFKDPAILPFPTLFRKLFAFIISNVRYKKSWSKYDMIGGSPLKASMNLINQSLSKELGPEYLVVNAYSYSSPNIKQGIDILNSKGVTEIKVIPMYPQSSYSTTGSVKRDISKIKNIKIKVFDNFYENKKFIEYWTTLINETISKNRLNNPFLLFSAHSIPEYHVNSGDSYVEEVNETASLITSNMGLRHKVSFQSKIGRVKWVEPSTISVLKELSNVGVQDVVIVPISFINENLETLYDLDIDIIPFGRNELNIKNLCRVNIPEAHPLLIQAFKNLILN